jgi:hypothetical protein
VQLSIISRASNTQAKMERMKLQNITRNSLVRKNFIENNISKSHEWTSKAELERLRAAAIQGYESKAVNAFQIRIYWETIFKEGLGAEHQRHMASLKT